MADTLPRWQGILAWASVGATVIILFALSPLTGQDLWMHLTIGRWIWQHGAVPQVDVFNFTTEGQPFVAHSWLGELVFHLIEQHAGTVGFMLLRFALIVVALTFVCATARTLKAPWPALMLLAPVVLDLMGARLEFRPQLFTTAFLALQLWLLMSVHMGRRSWRWLWALPPLYALWINLHGGWPQGMAMLVAFLGARVAMDVRHRWLGKNAAHVPHDHLPWRHLAVVLAVCGGALFINPYGARFVYFPLEMQAPWIRALGEEWQSPLTLIWSVWGVGIRELVVLSYLALLAGVLLLMTWRWRTADVVPIAVMGLWLALSLWHLRALSDTVLLTAPFIAAAWPPAWWRGRSWPTLAGSSLLLGPAALVLGSVVATWVAPPMGGFLCVVATMERLQLFGHVYMQRNSWADNTLLLYWFHPKILVQQTWEYVMGPAHMAELHEIVKEGGMFLQSHLDHYEVDTVVLTTGMFWRSAPGQRRLPGWVFVHMDNSFVVMVRQTAAAGMPQYDIIRPWDHIPVTPDNAHRVLEESTRALQQCPDGATFAWAYHANALWALGRHEEAGEAKRKVPEQIVLE